MGGREVCVKGVKRVKGNEGSHITRIGNFPLSELTVRKKCA